MNRWYATLFFSGLVIFFVSAQSTHTNAQVRSSTNYQLQSDSVNIGGGYSSSTSYVQESTAGEIATGRSSSTNFSLQAGYQQMQEVFLSMTVPSSVVLSPDLAGITGGTSMGSTSVIVTTDSPAGYELTIAASDSPAMQRTTGVQTIADYVPDADPTADRGFLTDATEAHFGFAPTGADIVQAYRTDGNDCNTGAITNQPCWDGLTTTAVTIVNATDANHPAGATTTLHFSVGIGGLNPVDAGTYIATTTLTALPL